MKNTNTTAQLKITRERLIQSLNMDLASVYKATIAFIVYSQVLMRANHATIARELELHAAEDFQEARNIANEIDSLGGTPCVRFSTVNTPVGPDANLLSSIVRKL